MAKCRICGKQTITVYNIQFRKQHVCDECANAITLQNVSALIQLASSNCVDRPPNKCEHKQRDIKEE